MENYQQNIDTLVKQFNSDVKNGLDENTIESARQKFGRNILNATNTRNVFQILFSQFANLHIVILIIAAISSFYLNQPRDGLILLIIVVLNALIGFYQEWKSENILASIKNLVVDKCNVIRQGKSIEIITEDLVVGDIVVLYEGMGVPADIRLIKSNELTANEFIITGESLASSKEASIKCFFAKASY